MDEKIAFVFSGQGAQKQGMGKELFEKSKAAAEVFKMADGIRVNTSKQCFEATKEELDITMNTQPCLFTVDLAATKALEEKGIKADAVLGFSLGEIAALGYAGIYTEKESFEIVCKRAEFMQEAAEENPGKMAAVLGMSEETLLEILSKFDKAEAVNFNCPGQISISFREEDGEKIEAAIKEAGGKFKSLAVSGAFHSSFMKPASEKLREFLNNYEAKKGKLPIYANLTGKPYPSDNEDIKETVALQVCNSVKWQKSIENAINDGINTFIEVGEGKVLCGLIRKINKDVKALHYTQALEI